MGEVEEKDRGEGWGMYFKYVCMQLSKGMDDVTG